MPVVSIDAMNQHLAEISKCVSVSAIALLILDGAGWHSSPQLILPKNIVLMPLPSYAPELNSVENIWDYLRSNFLSHCVWDTYEAILDACCDAWNALMAKSEVIVSIGTREWAQVETWGGWYNRQKGCYAAFLGEWILQSRHADITEVQPCRCVKPARGFPMTPCISASLRRGAGKQGRSRSRSPTHAGWRARRDSSCEWPPG